MTVICKYSGYTIGLRSGLSPEIKGDLVRLFESDPAEAGGVLSGRVKPVRAEIPGVGAVVVKHYRRGGVIRHLVRDLYLRAGKPRCRKEYEMLDAVRRLGVSSPEPLAWAARGRFAYRAFLVTREIPDQQSLSDIGVADPARCRFAIEKTAIYINLLLDHRIHHVDLHPGNVLVNEAGGVFVIDFDKARISRKSRERLRDTYLCRWDRAVKKYALPPDMTAQLSEALSGPGK